MSRKVMQIALEALEMLTDGYDCTAVGVEIDAINALKQALEDKQEPVAWASSLDFDDDDIEIISAKAKGKLGTSNCDIPLYTAPQRIWVGLTDEEIDELVARFARYELLHEVQAKLKERNHG